MDDRQHNIDVMYMTYVGRLAMDSLDPSTQNAAIIVRDNTTYDTGPLNVLGMAVNAFARGIHVSDERLSDRKFKYGATVHAEIGAILDMIGRDAQPPAQPPFTMYALWFACTECGKAILNAGITDVIGHSFPGSVRKPQADAKNWDDSIKFALGMLDEGGVRYRYIDDTLPGVRVRIQGDIYEIESSTVR